MLKGNKSIKVWKKNINCPIIIIDLLSKGKIMKKILKLFIVGIVMTFVTLTSSSTVNAATYVAAYTYTNSARGYSYTLNSYFTNYGVNESSAGYTSANPFAQASSDSFMLIGQCTWYAWGRAYEKTGAKLPCLGNANTWYSVAAANGYSVGTTPRANSIVVWNGTNGYGHVGFVEAVSGSTVYITDGNYDYLNYHEGTYNINYPSSYGTGLSLIGYIYLGGSTNTDPVVKDTTKPTVSSLTYSNISRSGFTVTASVSDNVGVTTVKFPTWTSKVVNGTEQDEIVWYSATASNGTASVYVPISDHNNEAGVYKTDVYAYDAAGNCGTLSGNMVRVPTYDTSTHENMGSAFYAKLHNIYTNKVLYNNTSNTVDMQDATLGEASRSIWKFLRQSDGSYKIVNFGTARCLDLAGANASNGTQIQTYADDNTAAQRWYIIKDDNSGYYLSSAVNPEYVIDIYGASTANYATVKSNLINSGMNQRFNFNFVTDSVTYSSHVQDIGWMNSVADGTTSGTSGRSLRIEAMKMNIIHRMASGSISYSAHVQNVGWQSAVSNDAIAGTTGRSLRVEAFKVNLTGDISLFYDVYYRAYCQNIGWLGWASNGSAAGSEGYGYRMEAYQVVLVPKGGSAPGSTDNAYTKAQNSNNTSTVKDASISYSVHVQDIGWMSTVSDNTIAGTTGQSKRLEAFKINLSNGSYTGTIQGSGHVQDIGWMNYVDAGQIIGTQGQNKRLESIKLRLTGTLANKYNIYYRVHQQDIGWTGWVANDAESGVTGQSKRIEAIQIKLVAK